MSSKVVITGIDTNSLPKLSGKEQAELMIKIKDGDDIACRSFCCNDVCPFPCASYGNSGTIWNTSASMHGQGGYSA